MVVNGWLMNGYYFMLYVLDDFQGQTVTLW